MIFKHILILIYFYEINIEISFTFQPILIQPHSHSHKVNAPLEKSGLVAYHKALPPCLSRLHNVFHVSVLRKYIVDPSHVLEYQPIQISQDTSYEE